MPRRLQIRGLHRLAKDWEIAGRSMAKAFAPAAAEVERAAHVLREMATRINWGGVDRLIKKYKHARSLPPTHRAHEPWRELDELDPTPRQLAIFEKFFPDPYAQRGRRKGTGAVMSDEPLLDAMDTRVKSGERPTAAARELLEERGTKGDLKGRADHLVRLWKSRAKN